MEGGSCNDYDYVCGDPVNGSDLAGTKARMWTPDESKRITEIGNDCLPGPDQGFSASTFCANFLTGITRNDLTDFGFGFTPDGSESWGWLKTIGKYAWACAQNGATGAFVGSAGAGPGAAAGAAYGCIQGLGFQLPKDHTALPDIWISIANGLVDLASLRGAIKARRALVGS